MRYLIITSEIKEKRDEDFTPETQVIIVESLDGYSAMKKELTFRIINPDPVEFLKHPNQMITFKRRFNGLGSWGFCGRIATYFQGLLARRKEEK